MIRLRQEPRSGAPPDVGLGSQASKRVPVDGGAPLTVSFPPTGGDRTGVATATVPLAEGAHALEFGNGTGWAPDFDRIALPNGPSTSLNLTGRPTYQGSPVVLANADEDNPLTVTFTNHGPTATIHPSVSLTAPEGWTVSRTGGPATGSVGVDRSTASSWTVKPPAGTAPGTYTLKAKADYRWNGELPATIRETIKVTVPPPAPTGTPYVSDLPVMSSSVGWGALQRDLSPGALPMVIEGVPYAKGLGAHAKSNVHLYLGGACRTFSAVVGIDDEDGPRGSVTFEVWADGRKVAETGVVRGTDPGLPLTADVTGATELELRATDAADGNHYDHSEWADARLTC